MEHGMRENHARKLVAILAADIAGYSALMGADEARTVSDLKAHQAVVLPMVGEFSGRVIDTAGDGIMAEFASVLNAVECAIAIQRTMRERNVPIEPERRMQYRIGINLGDVIYDDHRIYGDGINIAARLEGIADRGGICISRQVLDQVEGKLALNCRELGRQNLKNIARPVEAFAIQLDGVAAPGSHYLAAANLEQEIRYCRAPDGVRLAYATAGSGPPLLLSAHWLTHLEYDWEFPIRRKFLLGLADDHTLVRYDPRGNGLSDWDVDKISLDAWVSDMETVADAAGIERFPVVGFSQGCAVAIAFAVRHPERVARLVLYGGFAAGPMRRQNVTADDRRRFEAVKTLTLHGWGADNPAFRQIFTSLMAPTATREQMDAFNELQRLSASSDGAVRYLETVADLDVRELLPRVTMPTLVMHVRGDPRVPIAQSREIAAGIPGARFVALPGTNHVLLDQDPGLPRFLEELRNFLQDAD
jgi:class 3 adenylate cyclase/pimeloyl-ACP methyl ester carboxylesterase